MKTFKTELIEVTVQPATTQQQIFFGDQPKLRQAALLSMETFAVGNMAVSSTGIAMVNENLFKDAYLVLVNGSEEEMYRMPLCMLRRAHHQFDSGPAANQQNFVQDLTEFAGQNINWSKSYIWLARTTQIDGAVAQSFLFQVGWIQLEKIPKLLQYLNQTTEEVY